MALFLAAAPNAMQQEPAPHPAITEFMERVKGYVDMRSKIERSLPPLAKKEEDPAEIINHEKQIAAGIRAERAMAARGDIFIPAVQPILKDSIKQVLASKKGATVRAMIMGDGNPKREDVKIELKVNAVYPSAAPLSTMPPSLLLSLPTLPKGVEYRFVGRHLILYDGKANLIIDVLPDAIR